MSFPSMPQRPKDRYGHALEGIDQLGTVWSQLVNALLNVFPDFLRRLAVTFDDARRKLGG